jgi:hypothetical protein
VHPQVSQGNVTDWDFLRGLAVDVGAEVAVVDGKFEFRRPTIAAEAPGATDATKEPLVLEVGRNLLRLRAVVTSAEQVPQVQVRAWDFTAKRAVVGIAAATTKSAENGAKPNELAGKFGAPVLVAAATPYLTQAEVDDAAKALAEQVAGGFAELEGVLRGNPLVRAGTAVRLANAGEPFDGKYTVTASRHVFQPDTGYLTWVTVSGAQDRTLRGLVDGTSSDSAAGGKIRTGDGALTLDLDQQKTKITVHSDGTVTVEAKRGVTVDAGAGTLALTGQDVKITGKTGVTVEGARVSVNGSASTEVKGGASCSISAALVRIN